MPSTNKRPRRGSETALFTMPVMTAASSTSLRAVKVCGIVSAADAEMVARVARSILPKHVELLIGAIMWPRSKRCVNSAEAAAISTAARENGAKSVGVFVDEDIATIEDVCNRAAFNYAQLHGTECRQALRSAGGYFSSGLSWIDVRDVSSDGMISQEDDPISDPVWRIYDSKGGGTGHAFDWSGFQRPTRPWLLAGGLDPENVRDAVAALRPDGVDVASGVAKEDRCRKDEAKLRAFFERLVLSYK